ncbi:phosphoribosylanthranilate isomerase [Alkalibacillus haloalkaliphilus]|uniref:N-(5'-phosphoribosyl)anthranilate isomerase n=1 Tax=Alkalibacillus haloalkaliphilus TaxID=94136 RepID=A0A511W6U5_9BACI|nr:phosphoribosylanthranilate isomerase [Alkalibacillus haloalkaliphilus]GEN46028.1 N-(5'-phosphoribosyl)anthranilate isomerase [Alkalibacillus haloalkaliphilus]
MTQVKICGIKHTTHANEAVNAGADFLGFVFAESKRQVTVEKAKHISSQIPTHVKKVGVFVNASLEELEQTAKTVGLDYVQLHGDETPEFCEQLTIPYIKSFRIRNEEDLKATTQYNDADYLLLDSATGPYHGGNGTTFDWFLVEELPFDQDRFILAGGLNQENVKLAIDQTNPQVVDVSSGVELEGQKNINLIQSFIKTVKETS